MAHVSIVFRNRDGTHTGKIYISDYQAAAELASEFRNASHIVDVISMQDEIILRWEEGYPDWKHGETKPIKLTTELYRFERPEDAFWDVEGHQWHLTNALGDTFDVVTGRNHKYDFEQLRDHVHDHGGEDVWPLMQQAQIKADELAGEKNNDRWELKISDWMSNPEYLFIHHHVEHAALTTFTKQYEISTRIRRLEMELANISVQR